MTRPYCLTPTACTARSDKHCRRCSGTHWGKIRMAALRADPATVARMNVAGAGPRDPVITAKRIATMRANHQGIANIAAAAREHAKRMNEDPAICAARLAGLQRSVEGRVRRNAERMAAKAGIPVALVDEFSFLRWSKHYSQADAVGQLAATHPEAFQEIHAAERSAVVRAAGPQPAPGMERRGAWTRRVADGETRL